MRNTQRVVEFSGGPSDGLTVYEPRFVERDKVHFPLDPIFRHCGRTSCYELVSHRAAAYVLTSKRRRIGQTPSTTYLIYEFAGYERTNDLRPFGGWPRIAWLTNLARWLTDLPRRFGRWLIEPIDFPMRVSGESSEARPHEVHYAVDRFDRGFPRASQRGRVGP